ALHDVGRDNYGVSTPPKPHGTRSGHASRHTRRFVPGSDFLTTAPAIFSKIHSFFSVASRLRFAPRADWHSSSQAHPDPRLEQAMSIRWTAISVVIVCWNALAAPAAANVFDTCSGESGDAAIAACTGLIASGELGDLDLAVTYFNRGVTWYEMG